MAYWGRRRPRIRSMTVTFGACFALSLRALLLLLLLHFSLLFLLLPTHPLATPFSSGEMCCATFVFVAACMHLLRCIPGDSTRSKSIYGNSNLYCVIWLDCKTLPTQAIDCTDMDFFFAPFLLTPIRTQNYYNLCISVHIYLLQMLYYECTHHTPRSFTQLRLAIIWIIIGNYWTACCCLEDTHY